MISTIVWLLNTLTVVIASQIMYSVVVECTHT